MKFVVEDGTGLSLANSFCDVYFADTFCEENGITTWGSSASLTTEEIKIKKEQALIAASRWMSVTYSWKGLKYHNFQVLAFPRTGIDGSPVVIFPVEVKQATILAAVRIYAGKTLSPDLIHGGAQSSVKAGPVAIAYNVFASPNTVYKEIDDLVAPYSYGGTGSSCHVYVEIRK